ncbi:hypothetical protein O9X98_07425 [Agrobacterium salinitolerans]|nr:hypothetical protein [Agrobacterium salinitolerans]
MLTDIRYPVHFGGQPTTTDRYKVVLFSYPFRRDVDRIEASEVDVVLEVSGDVNATLVEYGGRLFRKVCGLAEAPGHRSLTEAFESAYDRNTPLHPASLWNAEVRPLGIGLWNRIAHRVYVNANGREGEKHAWPNAPFNAGTAHWNRNEFTFEKWSKKLGSMAGDEFDKALDEAEREADRLLWIGDELWVETPPLAYEVGYYADNNNQRFDLELAFLPDWLDLNLDRQYFPLSAKDEALAYAAQANALIKEREARDYTGRIKQIGAEVLEFDHVAYSLNRTALLMGGDLSVNIANKPDNARGLTGTHLDAINEARAEIANIGWNPSSWAVNHLAPDIVEAWQRIRPHGWTQFTSNRTNFSNLICERALDQFDAIPVIIKTNRQEPTQ